MRTLLTLLIGLSLSSALLADAIVLKDGTRLEGTIKKLGDQWHVTGADGKVTKVPVSSVKSIVLGSGKGDDNSTSGGGSAAPGNAAGNSDAGLASLRRSVEALTDINQIIERFERFVANTKDQAVLTDANKDLATWRERRDKGYIKQGTSWVTPEEAEKLRGKSLSTTAEAREQLRAGRVAEAESLLQQALNEDPTNPAALYLRGLMLYRADKLVDARKAFEAVNKSVERHAPTLNNLAVIVARQNQHGPALVFYDEAMQAQPVNKFILDNVADQLGTMPEDARKGKAVERVIRRFTEQDLILQQQLGPQGWFRWGSTWVDQKTLDELKAAEKEIKERIGAMESEFEGNKRRIGEIENTIRSNEREMQEMKSRSIWRDRDGRMHYMPLPHAYYDMQRENQNLRDEQVRLQVRFDQLRAEARQTQAQLPTPRFTGVQHVVGAEGTPLLPPPAGPPATSPVGG